MADPRPSTWQRAVLTFWQVAALQEKPADLGVMNRYLCSPAHQDKSCKLGREYVLCGFLSEQATDFNVPGVTLSQLGAVCDDTQQRVTSANTHEVTLDQECQHLSLVERWQVHRQQLPVDSCTLGTPRVG